MTVDDVCCADETLARDLDLRRHPRHYVRLQRGVEFASMFTERRDWTQLPLMKRLSCSQEYRSLNERPNLNLSFVAVPIRSKARVVGGAAGMSNLQDQRSTAFHHPIFFNSSPHAHARVKPSRLCY
jgi:hypothetical protein